MTATTALAVLFTDLVGSTELAASLARDDADALRRSHLAVLRAAVAATGGEEVKTLGDGLMVVFRSPSRALACAAAMQQGIARHNQRGGPPLAVRIGVSGGEVTEEDGDVFGDPVVEAARLCALSDGGQILVSATARWMAGRQAPVELVDAGERVLKGLPDPVATFEVRWQVTDGGDGPVPLPARLTAPAVDVFPFTGRAGELAALADVVKRADAGGCHVALVAGEPGVGKTALVSRAARSAHAAGAVVTFGASSEGLGAPYQAWAAALAHLVANDAADDLGSLHPMHAGALAGLLPTVADRFERTASTESGGGSDQAVLLDAVATVLSRCASRGPVVVVLDDLQWADAATLDLLRHLATVPSGLRLAVLATFRSSEVTRDQPLSALLAHLRRDPSVLRLDLGGLDDAEVVELMEATAGYALPAEGVALAHALRRETSGNPFFTVELLRHLGESGAFRQGDDGTYHLTSDVDALELPSSVREVIAHRVARLGSHAERVLTAAAVIGQDFDVDVLAPVTGDSEDDLLDVLDVAAAAGIVAEAAEQPGRYRFVHALIAHTLVQDLGVTRRQRAHRRVAEALEALGAERAGRVAELAHHWIAATKPSDLDRAVHYATLAGDEALAALAPVDACRWFRQALDLLERATESDPVRRGRLLVRLGRAQLDAGIGEHDVTTSEAGSVALATGDQDLLIEVALCRTSGYRDVLTADPDRMAVLDAALAAAGDRPTMLRARLLAAVADETDRRDWRRRRALCDEAAAIAMSSGDATDAAQILTVVAQISGAPDNLGERRRWAELAVGHGDADARTMDRFWALHALRGCCTEVADMAGIDACRREQAQIAERIGTDYVRWHIRLWDGFELVGAGDLAGAEAAANDVLALGTRAAHSAALSSHAAQLMSIRMQQGRVGEVVSVAEANVERFQTLPGWHASVTLMHAELGRFDEVQEALDRAFAASFEPAPFDHTWLLTMATWADAAADVRHARAASPLVDRLAPYDDRVVFTGAHTIGAVARQLGRVEALLGDTDRAEAHLRRSLELHERLGFRYWIGRSCLDLVELLRSTGRGAETDDLLRHASALADRYDLGGLRQRVDRVASGG